MPRHYDGVNLNGITDPVLRAALMELDAFCRDQSRASSESNPTVGGGNAPDNQPYVTIGNSARLSAERALVVTTPVVRTDNGANSNVNISLTTVPIAKGGTGQITQTEGFDALAPTTTKGDIIVHDGSDNIRLAKGTDTNVLTADSGEASGLKWAASGSASDVALYVKMFVPTATTTTVPTKHQILCHEEYIVEGTGELALEGTGELLVDDFNEPSRTSLLSTLNPVSYTVKSDKFWTFVSPAGAFGKRYYGGHFRPSGSDNTFSPSINFSSAGFCDGGHFFIVISGADSDPPVITVSGATIDDDGTLNTVDSEVITVGVSAAADTYYETAKKWIGQLTIETTSGTAILCNYGLIKYWDNMNTDFTVVGVEATWLGAATDNNPNIAIYHHKATGWTYNAGAAPTLPTRIAELDEIGPIYDGVLAGFEGAWKRVGLSTAVAGSGSEGIFIEVTTSANKAFEVGTVQVQIEVAQTATLT